MRKLFVLLTSLVVICGLVLNGDLTFASPKSHAVDAAFLQSTYNSYNEAYFGNHLPKDTAVLYAPDPDDPTNIGATQCSLDIQTEKPTHCTIYIAPYANVAQPVAIETLIHESCHIATWEAAMHDGEGSHGKEWKACMMGVALSGGFDGVW